MAINEFISQSALKLLAQGAAYGDGAYGADTYNCQDDEVCTTADAGVPNTGFLGVPQEAAVAGITGGVLLLIALVAGILFARSKARKRKKSAQP